MRAMTVKPAMAPTVTPAITPALDLCGDEAELGEEDVDGEGDGLLEALEALELEPVRLSSTLRERS